MAALPIKEEARAVKEIGEIVSLKDLPNIEVPAECDQRMDTEDEKIFKAVLNHFGNRLNDVYYESIMRFVHGYSHEKEREKVTIEKLEHYMDRFSKFNWKEILETPMDDEDNCLKSWPVFIYGYDKQGHPVMYDEIASSTVDKVKQVFAPNGEIDYVKLRTFRFRFLRRLEQVKFLQSERYGKKIYKHIMIMDMKNFSHKHLHQQMRHLVADVIDDESNLFPDTLYRMYIINAPLPFRFAWKIVSNFIHPITVEKIQILGSDYLKKVTKDIDITQLPQSYKGKGKLPINYGYVADIENNIIDKFSNNETLKVKFLNENGLEDESKDESSDNINNNNNNNNNNNTNNTINKPNINGNKNRNNDDEKNSESNGNSVRNNSNNNSNANGSYSDARVPESMSNLKVTG